MPTPLKDDFQAATNIHARDYRRKLNIWATTEGYCYLCLFKKKYQHFTHMKYGAYPYWGELDLRAEHRMGDFKDLNISICYETENMHIERDFQGIHRREPNKCFDNMALIDNPWHLRFRIGSTTATTTRTRMEVEEDSNPDASGVFSMQRLMEVDNDSRTQNEGDAESESSETAFA